MPSGVLEADGVDFAGAYVFPLAGVAFFGEDVSVEDGDVLAWDFGFIVESVDVLGDDVMEVSSVIVVAVAADFVAFRVCACLSCCVCSVLSLVVIAIAVDFVSVVIRLIAWRRRPLQD